MNYFDDQLMLHFLTGFQGGKGVAGVEMLVVHGVVVVVRVRSLKGRRRRRMRSLPETFLPICQVLHGWNKTLPPKRNAFDD